MEALACASLWFQHHNQSQKKKKKKKECINIEIGCDEKQINEANLRKHSIITQNNLNSTPPWKDNSKTADNIATVAQTLNMIHYNISSSKPSNQFDKQKQTCCFQVLIIFYPIGIQKKKIN